MTSSAKWLQEGSIIYVEYAGDVTYDDIEQASTGNLELIENASTTTTFTLINTTRVQSIAFTPKQLVNCEAITEIARHPNLGWIVLYPGQNALVNFMTTLVAGSKERTRTKIMNSLEDALAFIEHMGGSLTVDWSEES